MPLKDQITAGERRELRSVVRSQMKALRAEVKQRELTLDAEIEKRLIEKFRDDNQHVEELQKKINQLTNKCNEQLHKLVEAYENKVTAGNWSRVQDFHAPHVYRRTEKREDLRRALIAGMKAEISAARVAIDRQEADLLQKLSVDALRSASALEFMETILRPQQLVSAQKLVEIEAQYEAAR